MEPKIGDIVLLSVRPRQECRVTLVGEKSVRTDCTVLLAAKNILRAQLLATAEEGTWRYWA